MRVRYTARASRDLIAILDYLEDRSRKGARRVRRALDRTIELIGRFPEAGRVYDDEGTRVLPAGRYPYLVFWIIEAHEAWIVHIRDGRRRSWRQGAP